jgi:hypothetical protein
MQNCLQNIIKNKVEMLVHFVLEKHPETNKDHVYHKLRQLGLWFDGEVDRKSKEPRVHKIKKIVIKVKKTKFLNYLLSIPESGFDDLNTANLVFDVTTNTVVGVEAIDGTIEPLTRALIQICDKYKLRRKLPLNLNVDDDSHVDLVNKIQDLRLNHLETDDEDDDA